MKRESRQGIKRIWVIVSIIAVVVVVVAIATIGITLRRGGKLFTATSLKSDSSFVVGLTDKPNSLNIQTDSSAAVSQALLANVYETLVARDNDNNLTAGLASSWDVTDDGLTYTFHLHPKMNFANGDSLTAADVVWSLQQIVQDKLVGYDDLTNLQSVTNSDDNTVVITLSAPNPALLRALSGRAGVVYDRDQTIDYNTQAAGSGPFTVKSFSNNQLVLTKNTKYWGTAAAASQITLQYYSSNDDLTQAVSNNDVDLALPTASSTAEEALSNPAYSVNSGVSCKKMLVAFNSKSESPFSDEQVRKAARYALNAADIASTQKDAYEELSGPISQLVPGYADLNNLFPYDSAKSRSMLAFFAYGYVKTLDFLVPSQYQSLGETVKSNMESGGFSVNLEVVDQATLTSRLNSGDYDMALMTMDSPDDYRQFATSDNVFHYINGEAQEAYQTAMAATNDADYVSGLESFAQIVSENAACGWLYTMTDFVVSSTKVSGYPTNFTSIYLPLAKLTR